MKKELVSIITPCCNGEAFLDRYIHSILNQTYTCLEVLFIDDGSKDKTKEILEKYRNKFEEKGISIIYSYQKNAGQAAAVNRGLKMMTGEFLTLIDADDEIMPCYIEKKVDFLQKNRTFHYCYGKAVAVCEEDPEKIVASYEKRQKSGRYDFFEDLIFVRNVFFPGYMIRTGALDQVVPDRDIYTGRGGQNAQILLPLAWYYGEPGFEEHSVYKYFIRKNSHSHSQNNSEKRIQQLYLYENILLNTLKRIPDSEAAKYGSIIKKYYSKLRFGNAVDTKNSELISRQFKELRQAEGAGLKDFILYMKYTNQFMKNKGIQ